ncbi:MAG: hypothetical protein ACYDIE_03580 [Candidatus Krumholzibacteriia bacterium]
MRADTDELSTSTVVTVGVVAGILLFAAIIFLQAYFARAERAGYERRVAQLSAGPDTVLAAQAARLDGSRWVDRARGIVTIPIDRARALEVKELPARGAAPAPASPPPD